MVSLPDNWQETIRVSPRQKALFLYFRNDANEYWLYFMPFDPAYSLQQSLEQLEAKLTPEYLMMQQATQMHDDLSEEVLEPSDQNWHPAYLPGADIVSIAQYKAMLQIPGADEPKVEPIPGPEGLPKVE